MDVTDIADKCMNEPLRNIQNSDTIETRKKIPQGCMTSVLSQLSRQNSNQVISHPVLRKLMIGENKD